VFVDLKTTTGLRQTEINDLRYFLLALR